MYILNIYIELLSYYGDLVNYITKLTTSRRGDIFNHVERGS